MTIERTGDIPKQLLWERAGEIVEGLADSCYAENYQPTYLDQEFLTEAVHEVMTTGPVTQPEHIEALGRQLGDLATGTIRRPLVITGNCSEPVVLNPDELHTPARISLKGLDIVQDSLLSHAIHIRRERGQNTKPRSEENEILPNGEIVMSYMGDSINRTDPARREPDPSLLVAAAIQARDIEEELMETLGQHVPAAHEALNLYYEKAFLRTVKTNDGPKTYLLSADLPWIGLRTNDPDGDHVELLSGIENPVGIKLGASTTAEHLAQLSEKLNPHQKPGKLVLMPRFGLENHDRLPEFLENVKRHAPHSLMVYDVHGTTVKLANGRKNRFVRDIKNEINSLSMACRAADLVLHGLHLETTTDDSRLECIDSHADAHKQDEGGIDPQLNPKQTVDVLNVAVRSLL